jgi:hypothetical protein
MKVSKQQAPFRGSAFAGGAISANLKGCYTPLKIVAGLVVVEVRTGKEQAHVRNYKLAVGNPRLGIFFAIDLLHQQRVSDVILYSDRGYEVLSFAIII